MIEPGGQNGPVPFAFERGGIGPVEQGTRFGITNGWGRAFVAIGLRALHALDRIMRDGVVFAQVTVEGGQFRELAPDSIVGFPVSFA